MPRPVLCRVTPSDPLVTVRDKGATREIVIFEHLCSVLNSLALDNSCYWICLKNVYTFSIREKVTQITFELSGCFAFQTQWIRTISDTSELRAYIIHLKSTRPHYHQGPLFSNKAVIQYLPLHFNLAPVPCGLIPIECRLQVGGHPDTPHKFRINASIPRYLNTE